MEPPETNVQGTLFLTIATERAMRTVQDTGVRSDSQCSFPFFNDANGSVAKAQKRLWLLQ